MAKRKLILNRYRPLGKAGEGGFSTVVAAFDTHLKRNVAIKVIELDAFTAQELAWSMGLGGEDDEDRGDGTFGAETVGGDRGMGTAGSNGDRIGADMHSAATRSVGADMRTAATRAVGSDAHSAETRTVGTRFFRKNGDWDALDNEELSWDDADEDADDLSSLPDATPSRLITPEDERAAGNLPGLSEAQVAGNLGSPHIVSVYDLVLEGTTAYLIMEYVDGTSLKDFLAEHDDDLTLDIMAAVVDGVASALEVAHRHNVLHLDIKPGNIMIDKQGQVKVTDFGMAAVPDAQGVRHGEGGTIGYMPPEQMDREPLDERCDEWALASVTYQMLSGQNPFEAPDLAQAQEAILHAELVLPSLMWADLDGQADDVLFYALDPDREERYETVSDFAEEMVPLLGSPKRGKRELAELMAPTEDADEVATNTEVNGVATEASTRRHEPEAPSIPLRERLTPGVANVAGRAFAVVATTLITGFSLANVPLSGTMVATVIGVVVAVGAIGAGVLPCVGPLVAYASLAVALIMNDEIAPGIVLLIATAAWWGFAVEPRRVKAAPNIALSTPLASGFGLGPLASLAAGYYLTVGKAAATAAHSFVVATVLASLGARNLTSWAPLSHLFFASSSISATDGLIYLAQQPWVWAIGVSWVVAAVALSLCCSRGARWLAIVGSVVAGAVLAFGLVAARSLATAGVDLVPAGIDILSVVGCTAAAIVCSAITIPGTAE